MSEETSTVVAGEPAQATEVDWKAKYEEALEHSRKWESRSKANSDAAQKLTEIEEAQKTEQQRLTDRLKAAEDALLAKESEAARLSVIASKGIPVDYHDLVRGSTQEELEASAAKVASLIQATAEVKPSPLIIPAEGKTPTGALGGSKQAFADAIADLL